MTGSRTRRDKRTATRTSFAAVLMGSASDADVMKPATEALKLFDISFEVKVLSAHRAPEALVSYVVEAEPRGCFCFIAGAGGAAHLAGVVASRTVLPVLAVPIPTKHLQGLDSLLSMVQMPKGVPVATFAIGGAFNAGLFAVSILAARDEKLREKLAAYRRLEAERSVGTAGAGP